MAPNVFLTIVLHLSLLRFYLTLRCAKVLLMHLQHFKS